MGCFTGLNITDNKTLLFFGKSSCFRISTSRQNPLARQLNIINYFLLKAIIGKIKFIAVKERMRNTVFFFIEPILSLFIKVDKFRVECLNTDFTYVSVNNFLDNGVMVLRSNLLG